MSNPKSMARRSAVQAIYQWQLTGYNLSEIERQFVEEHGLSEGELPYFQDLLHQVPRKLDVIDAALAESPITAISLRSPACCACSIRAASSC